MSSPPLEVVVTRGALVESRHAVHAVALRDGEIVLEAGDASLVAFMRSSAKPIQALPLVRARPDLADREIAIACSSHLADEAQLAAVRRLLALAPADESELETGPEPTPLEHNCSGKHAGFLALCRSRSWPSTGYRLAGHPLQQEMLREVAAAAEVDPAAVPVAVDGCGVSTFALSLERMALAFARLPGLEGGARAVAAMRSHPDLVRGPQAADAIVMRELPGWVAKGGAEGLMCASGPGGLGVALRVADGATRAVAAALAEVVHRLGFEPPHALLSTPVPNSHGETIGEVRLDTSVS